MKDRTALVESILRGALELEIEPDRDRYIEEACGGDVELKAEVCALLKAHSDESSVFDDANLKGSPVPDDTDVSGLGVAAVLSEGPGSVISRYKLLQQIGEGGMGIVYMAEQTEPVVRKVALKIIKLGMDTCEVVARFEAERQALALMDHPNIARVFDGGATDTGRPFFVMELVQGVPINEFCDKNCLSTEERIRLFIPVCQAIQSAHQKGIIHRDIKPSNIMVTLLHGEPVVKVIDFGVAKATHQKLTEKTLFTKYATMIGTPAYMSPEQAEMSAMDVDTRTDVYSLGVVLYELLIGSTPFPLERLRSAGFGEIQRIIFEEEPDRPSTRLSTLEGEQKTELAKLRNAEYSTLQVLLKGDLDWIAMKCLEKDRRRRYETPSALAADLVRFLDDEPVTAAAPTLTYYIGKLYAKHKGFVWGVAAAAVILILATVVSGFFAIRMNQLRNDAEIAKDAEAEQRARAVDLAEDANRAKEETKAALIQSSRQLTLAMAEQARGWLERAELLIERKDYFSARMMAGRAIGFRGFGRRFLDRSYHQQYPYSLGQRDPKYNQAVQILLSKPAYSLIWESPSTAHAFGGINCVDLSHDGSLLAVASSDRQIRVWNVASGHLEMVVKGHSGSVSGIDFSPDGAMLASCSDDRSVRLWEVETGRLISLLRGHSSLIRSVEFSPDGSLVASSSQDRTIRLWNVRSGQLEAELVGHSNGVTDAAFSPNGSMLASSSLDHSVRLWDLASGRLLRELVGHPGVVNSVAFNSDGSTLASGGDNSILLWDPETGQQKASLSHARFVQIVEFSPDDSLLASWGVGTVVRLWDVGSLQLKSQLPIDSLSVNGLAFSSDGSQLISAGHDNSIVHWDIESGQANAALTGHSGSVNSIDFSPDGSLLASGSLDGITVWEVATGRLHTELVGHSAEVLSVVFSADGTQLASGGDDYTIRIWDTATGESKTELVGHSGLISSLAFNSDGSMLASGSADRSVRLWDLNSGRLRADLRRHSGSVYTIAFSPDNSLVASGSADDSIILWDVETAQPRRRLMGHIGNLTSVSFSPDGSMLASGSEDHSIRFWDVSTGQLIQKIEEPWGQVRSIAFSPNGSQLVSGNDDQSIRLWDVESGQLVAHLNRQSGSVLSVSFSPDGSLLASGHAENLIALWDIDPGKFTLKHPSPSSFVRAVAATPNSSLLASAHSNSTDSESWISIWDSSSGQLSAELRAQSNPINSLAYSNDGSLLASGSRDGIARIWDVESAGIKAELTGRRGNVLNLAFNPGGSLLAAGATNRTIHLWDIASGKLNTRLPAQLSRVQSVQFSPDGSLLALGGNYGSLVFWNVASGKLEAELAGHGDSIRSLAFTHDGSLLASGSADHSVRLWEVESGRLIRELLGHTSPVRSLRFNSDGTRLVSGTADNTIGIWDVSAGELLVENNEESHRSPAPPTLSFLTDGTLMTSITDGDVIRRWAPEVERVAPNWGSYLEYIHIGGKKVDWTVNSVSTNLYQSTPGISMMPISENRLLSILNQPVVSVERWRELFWRFYRSANWRSAENIWRKLVDLDSGQKEGAALAEVLMHCSNRAIRDGRMEIAQWYARSALRIDPRLADAHRMIALAFLELDRPTDALQSLEEAFNLIQSMPECLQLKARALKALDRPQEAIETITHALGQLDDSALVDQQKRQDWTLFRAELFLSVGDHDQALRDRLDGLDIPHRDLSSEYPPELIDLSMHYHAALTVNWGRKVLNPENTLKSLIDNHNPARPITLPDVGEIPFDLRGVIQLSSGRQFQELFPSEVKGIGIGQTFNRIHFLQATDFKEYENLEVGRYVLHYADGTTETIPLIFGSNTFNWWRDSKPISEKLPELRFAWQGEHPHARIALYLASWENPKPNVKVESFDFISAQATAAPFLVAITVE